MQQRAHWKAHKPLCSDFASAGYDDLLKRTRKLDEWQRYVQPIFTRAVGSALHLCKDSPGPPRHADYVFAVTVKERRPPPALFMQRYLIDDIEVMSVRELEAINPGLVKGHKAMLAGRVRLEDSACVQRRG
jgi:hypothetical protein